jgi:hypothetical protein
MIEGGSSAPSGREWAIGKERVEGVEQGSGVHLKRGKIAAQMRERLGARVGAKAA